MSLRNEKLLFLDCQTTGMHPSLGQVLEISWCLASAGDQDPAIVSHLIQLDGRAYLSKRVQEITGIKPGDMSEAIPMDQAREHLLMTLGSDQKLTAMIHYAQFEKPFLREFFDLQGEDSELPFAVLCTHKLSKRLLPHVPSRNIRALSGHFGAHFNEVKRAAQHVRATFEIWKGLLPEFEGLGLESLSRLSEWLESTPKVKSERYEYKVDRDKRLKLPDRPGVYRMKARNGEILYVGKATSLKDRVNSYFRGRKGRDPRKLEMMAQAWDLEVTECGSALEAALLETDEIKRHNPPYNVSLKRARRRLLFYSRDFESTSTIQDETHLRGAFRTMNAIEDLRVLHRWVETGDASGLFYDLLPLEDLAPAYAIFKQKWALSDEAKTFRGRLALALKIYRKQPESSEGLVNDSEVEAETESEAAIVPEAEPVITVEEIALKFERMYMRAAQTLVRAKHLTQLLNSKVRWQENESWRELVISRGQINQVESTQSQGDDQTAAATRSLPWKTMDIADYDRMSVLLSELASKRHEIQFLSFS